MSKEDKIFVGGLIVVFVAIVGVSVGYVLHWNATHRAVIAVFDTAKTIEQAACDAAVGPDFRATYAEQDEDGDFTVDILPLSTGLLACIREHWFTADEVRATVALPSCNRQRAYEDLARLGKLSGETLAACGIHEA